MDKPFSYKDCRFHHISTDEVYESDLFTEETPYAPSDMIIRSYGLNTVQITMVQNNLLFVNV